jgi:hypothetical protein
VVKAILKEEDAKQIALAKIPQDKLEQNPVKDSLKSKRPFPKSCGCREFFGGIAPGYKQEKRRRLTCMVDIHNSLKDCNVARDDIRRLCPCTTKYLEFKDHIISL